MLIGEMHGRRDHVFIYSVNSLRAVVQERFKMNAPKTGENPITAKLYDLYQDIREEYPVSTEVGAWGGAEFARIIVRPMQRKEKTPTIPRPSACPTMGSKTCAPSPRQS